MFFFYFFLSRWSRRVLTLSPKKRMIEGSMFKDGVSVDDELKHVDLEIIRAVCGQQCMSQWTAIATRERLYQFIAMSDEVTQREMRLSLLSTTNTDIPGSVEQAINSRGAFGMTGDFTNTRGSKR